MNSENKGNDQLLFADEAPLLDDTVSGQQAVWNILVVDDELDVHQVTKLSLKGLKILGRDLNIVHADSAAEAEIQIKSGIQFAVILLDVVMETEDAGLNLVKKIREKHQNNEIRIILRTGQPGQAPEASAISNYDINDYRLKTELTRVHLVTSLTAAIRSYEQIRTIKETTNDLAFIVDATKRLMNEKSLYTFGVSVLESITQLLNHDHDAFLSRSVSGSNNDTWVCFAGTGIYSSYVNHYFDPVSESEIILELQASKKSTDWQTHTGRSTLKITTIEGSDFIFSIDGAFTPTAHQLQSLQILTSSIAVGLENQSLVDNLAKLAWQDPLTKLPNRAKLVHILETVVMDSGKHDLYILDIDDFDTVNDGLGQDMGDYTLIEIGNRLNSLEGDSLVAARLSGDTFAILGRHEELSPKKINTIFDQPISIGQSEIRLNASMGVVHHVYESGQASVAIRRATLALHQAKSHFRGTCMSFGIKMETDINERLGLVGGLGDAIKNDQLCLHYQPKVLHSNKKIIGMEALMRWPTEDGFIPPFKFIPVAESSGLIFELEYFLVKQTCIDLVRLNNEGLGDLTIAINVSAPVLESDEFFEYFKATLAEYDISPSKIYVEITESVMVRNREVIRKRLEQFRSLGTKCSLDDFGTGYNSLTYLNLFPIDQIKIDKSFVDDIHTSDRTKFLNESIITLARNLNLEVVAEGIEEQEQFDILTDLGCDQTQGYLFSKPVSIDDLIPWIHKNLSS